MCGICGMVGKSADPLVVRKMTASIAHRGPDGEGIYSGSDVILGHRRLSVIDLVSGQQPMTNEDGSLWVVYNGEIYNFQRLRRDLEDKGHRFTTQSDTEVLLHGFEEYGVDFLPKLDGIFAFALWDSLRKRLLLVRDYFGVKPLHYHFDGHTLRFASEIKAILQDPNVPREPDYQSIHYFMNLRYIPGEGTLLKGVKRLEPAHYLIFADGKISFGRYFDLNTKQEPCMKEEGYYLDGIRHYLREAVCKQRISDVPLGVYLSGGLDSSALVAFMSDISSEPVKTFSMGFNEPTDELEDARVVADHFGTEHHELTLSPDPLRQFPEVIWHAEEPKENILQGYLLSKFASRHVKVCLGGLGGDELFAGYRLHQFIYPVRHWHRFVPDWAVHSLFQPLSRLAYSIQNASGIITLDEYRRGLQMLLSLGDPERYYLILRNVWDYDSEAFKSLYGPELLRQVPSLCHIPFDRFFASQDMDALNQVLQAEFHTKMPEDFLMNEDRTSMANGLEVRVPFLDRDLVRFVNSIPIDLRMRHNQPKYLFRKAMTGLLPPHTLAKKKWGFSFNPYYQFQKDLKTTAESVLTKERVTKRGLFNYAYLERILCHPPHHRLRWHYFFLWLVLGLEIWFQMFVEGNVAEPVFNLESFV